MGVAILTDWLQVNEVKRAIDFSLKNGKINVKKLDLFRIERAIDSRYSFKFKDRLFKDLGIIYIEYRRKVYLYKNGDCSEC